MVGRITPWKGQDVFLAAFADAFPNGPERAVIVGSAMFGAEEEQFADELRRIAERLGIADRTEFRGFRENVVAEMQGFNVIVHASITPEPFGQVIVEAMSAGTPVVASRAGGPEEIISDGENGLLYQPGDHRELARLMLRMRDEPRLAADLSRGGLQRACAFHPGGIAQEIESAYVRALIEIERQQ
jgi:glycosyltransferase involved in cell wall biosynthesis